MKKVIRNGCFETNSSSQHSIIVTKNNTHINPSDIVWDQNKDFDEFDNVYIGADGRWHLYHINSGYGRYPFQILTSFEDKLKYAMCEFMGQLYEDDPEWQKWYEEFESIAHEFVPGFKGFYIATKDVDMYLDEDGNDIMMKDLIYNGWNSEKEHVEYLYADADGNKHEAIFNEESYMEMPEIGMIDHQSAGLLTNFLKEKGITLREFLTNKKYNVVIDGDEYCDFDRYKASGLINKDFIVEEYDTSGDDIKYQEWLKEQENEESDS